MQHKGKYWKVKEIGRERKTKVVKKVIQLYLSDKDYMGNYTGKVYVFRGSYDKTVHIAMCEYRNGLIHHDSRPALRYLNGSFFWYKEDKLHRIDGPTVEHPNGGKQWWINGELHREDGPAVEYSDGTKEWWVDGVRYYQNIDITDKIFLGKERGKYGIEWVRFLDKERIKEYPILPGLEYVYCTKNIEDLV